MGFLFEKPIEDPSRRDEIERGLGVTTCHQRWEVVEEIHFVFSTKAHGYHCKTARGPHGQMLFVDFQKELRRYLSNDRLRIFLYLPSTKVVYSNHFLFVDPDCPIVKRRPFQKVKDFVSKKEKQGKLGKTDSKRQKKHFDQGYSTMRNTATKRVRGHAIPKLVIEDDGKEFLSWLSEFAIESDADWCPRGTPPHVQDEYMANCHSLSLFHNCRSSSTGVGDMCLTHRDLTNSLEKPDVLGLSYIDNGRRYAINGQCKEWADQMRKKVEKTGDFQSDLINAIESVGKERLSISPLLFANERFDVAGFEGSKGNCNMDPIAYIQPSLFGSALMAEHFSLNFNEVVGVVLGASIEANCKFYFGCAAVALLQLERLPCRHSQIGRLLGQMSRSVRLRSNMSNVRILRYNGYIPPTLPSEKEWEEYTHTLVTLCLYCWRNYSEKPVVVKELEDVYQWLHSKCQVLAGMGVLAAHHFLAELSCLGCLPEWVREYCNIVAPGKRKNNKKTRSRPMQHFCQEYPDMADQLKGGPKLLSTIKSMKALLEEHFEGIVFHERKIENVFCKVYRIHGGDDYLWFDCLLSGQVLFSFDGDSVLVMTDNGRKRYLDGSAIISLAVGGRARNYERHHSKVQASTL
jgi:hypothetical protein